jgi:uncharacterized phage protein gp47/JayE
MSGLTPAGFVRKTFDAILSNILADIRSVPSLSRVNLGRDSFLGGVVVAAATGIAELWEVAEAVYASFDPDSASGRSLEHLAAIVGKYRRKATATQVECDVTATAAVTFAAGELSAYMAGRPEYVFRNRDEVVFSGAGTESNVIFRCDTTGAIAVPANTLTVIATPVANWSAVNNPSDGVPGLDIESDAELRARRLVFSDTNALASNPDVRKLFIFENVTDATVDGRPPHSFEAVVWDGTDTGTILTDQTIAEAIFADKPAGIATHGDVSVVVEDENGYEHTVKFSRPTVLAVYVKVHVTKGAGWDDTDSPAAIKAALAAYALDKYTCGSPVVRAFLFGPVAGVPGVADITDLFIDTSPSPASEATIVTTAKQIPRIETVNVEVVAAS